jgi:hypothetical protein
MVPTVQINLGSVNTLVQRKSKRRKTGGQEVITEGGRYRLRQDDRDRMIETG